MSGGVHINRKEEGRLFENQAAAYLAQQGYRILEQNFRSTRGEIDLIAEDDGTLVFAEVKYRSSGRAGSGAEAVDARKQQRIVHCARVYLMMHKAYASYPCRFDVLSFENGKLKHYRDAFWA